MPTLTNETLRVSEERYLDLFEHANDAVFTTDLQMRLTSLNPAGQAITGYSQAEARELTVDHFVPAEYQGQIHEKMRDQFARHATPPIEAEFISKDGRRIPIEVSVHLIAYAGQPVGIQGIARDISERRRLEGQLRQAQRMEAIGRLAGGIAHDFNNLVTVIHSYSSELAASLEPSDPRKDLALEICKAGDSAARLTRQLLAFGRPQILQPRGIDLTRIVLKLSDMLRRLVGRDVELVTVSAPDVYTIRVDPGQIEQVIIEPGRQRPRCDARRRPAHDRDGQRRPG